MIRHREFYLTPKAAPPHDQWGSQSLVRENNFRKIKENNLFELLITPVKSIKITSIKFIKIAP